MRRERANVQRAISIFLLRIASRRRKAKFYNVANINELEWSQILANTLPRIYPVPRIRVRIRVPPPSLFFPRESPRRRSVVIVESCREYVKNTRQYAYNAYIATSESSSEAKWREATLLRKR